MNNLPCRFHLNIESVLKQEGLRVTKQRLAIWDEIKSSESHREIEAVLISLKKTRFLFQEQLYIELLKFL